VAFPYLNNKIMENINEGPAAKKDADKDNPTKPFANSEKKSAASINKSEGQKARGEGQQGPNYDAESKNVDGDTTVNAGVFK
jgi:hypothetical protein